MVGPKTKCIILLSSKSSGSSALQNLVCKSQMVNHVTKTGHNENETLYWVKAASILGLPQYNMLDSEVPIARDKARSDLISFLSDNLDSYQPPSNDHDMIFGGWQALCEHYGPVFFEKSPHHLHQWSALELINQCVEKSPETDFLVIGLVRNPMDTIYSRWYGGRSIPEKYQYEWLKAYTNLLEFEKVSKVKMLIVKYEDMVDDLSSLKGVYDFIGDAAGIRTAGYLHKRSLAKWKKDKWYGFQLDDKVQSLGLKLGYDISEMSNPPKGMWPIHRSVVKAKREVSRPIRLLKNNLRNRFKSEA